MIIDRIRILQKKSEELEKLENEIIEEKMKELIGIVVLGYTLRVVTSRKKIYLHARKKNHNIYIGRIFTLIDIERKIKKTLSN